MKFVANTALRRRQEGVALVMALIVLVAMTLAGLAMMRSVDSSALIAGNLAFKQSAAVSADAGVEAAIAWLNANPTALGNDDGSNGYAASSQDNLDLTGNGTAEADDDLDWKNTTLVKQLAVDSAGNQVSYVIHRMCQTAGALDPGTCSTATGAGTAPQGTESIGILRPMLTYQPLPGSGASSNTAQIGLYRITVRVAGPRSNVSFVQAIISQ
ncbi:MAG TPA: PilX N-terminal domain-containing pilus assembly protein [Pseudoduganella sp.]